ncbi:MAG: hypothetical protein C4305_07270 [Thermoleophilia bacterium]
MCARTNGGNKTDCSYTAPEGMVDLFAAAGLKTPDSSILSDEFLSEMRGMPQRNEQLSNVVD